MLTEIITAVILAVIPLLATLITSKLIPWIKARTTSEQRKNLMSLVRTAVRAAEQVFRKATGDGTGAEKKAFVVAQLRAEGVTESVESLSTMIEAAVLELHVKQEWGLEENVEYKTVAIESQKKSVTGESEDDEEDDAKDQEDIWEQVDKPPDATDNG